MNDMSLDVDLINPIPETKECPCCGKEQEVNETLYEANITHNLSSMASEAGIYEALWCPEKLNIDTAKDLKPILKTGFDLLVSDSERFKKFNPKNGWGNYENLVNFVAKYLSACCDYPEAKIRVSR